jgi:hypothetical protein
MQKWEYLQISRSRIWGAIRPGESVHRASDWKKSIHTADGELNIGKKDMPDLLARLGEDGWELVSISPRSSYLGGSSAVPADYAGFTDHEVWVFKRPKE